MYKHQKKQDGKNKVKIITISEYIKRRLFITYQPAKFVDGQLYRYDGKEWMTSKKFNELYPKPIVNSFRAAAENPDGQHSYLNN